MLGRRTGSGGIFSRGSSLRGCALGDNGKPASDVGAGGGAVEWVMDWASGEEARPSGETARSETERGVPWTGDVLDTTEALVRQLETMAAGGRIPSAQQLEAMVPAAIPAATRMQILQRVQAAARAAGIDISPTWIPGVPNWATAAGGVALGFGLLHLLKGTKKGGR